MMSAVSGAREPAVKVTVVTVLVLTSVKPWVLGARCWPLRKREDP